jgi:hypothetical protein
MHVNLRKVGLLLSLLFFIYCQNTNVSHQLQTFEIDEIEDTLTYTYDKRLNWYYSSYSPSCNITTNSCIKYDTVLLLSNVLNKTIDSIFLSERIESNIHHFFGDIESGTIYSSSFSYNTNSFNGIYQINLKSGKVRRYYAEIDFMPYGERFGRSLINQFCRNDTFFLGFDYPYFDNADNEVNIWEIPHMGIGYLTNDTIRFIKAFGHQKPRLSKEYVWKHPKMCYLPEKNEILFSYYWSDSLLVYDFKGNLKQRINTKVAGFNHQKFFGNNYKPGCFDMSEWDSYVQDSVLYFSQVGYYKPLNLYYRTIKFEAGDRRGNSAILLFNADRNEQRLVTGFDDIYGFHHLEESGIYTWKESYDSSGFRVSRYLKYSYPKGWFPATN